MRPEPKLQLVIGLAFNGLALTLLMLFFLYPGLFLRLAEHHTDFADVSGLRVGAEVNYAGFVVGRVGAIEPNFAEGSFDVTLRLRRDWMRKADVVAKIDETNPFRPASIALIEDAGCDTDTGKGERWIPGCGRRTNVIDLASSVADEALRMLESIKGLVAGFGGDESQMPDTKGLIARVEQVLDNLAAATASLRLLATEERIEAVGGAVDRFARTTDRLGTIVSDERAAAIANAVDDLAVAATSARKIMAQTTVVIDKANQVDPALLNRTAQSIERTSSAAGDLLEANQANITTAVREAKFMLQTTSVSLQQVLLNLEEASRNLSDLSARLRDDPSVLLRGRNFRSTGGDGGPN